MRIWYWLVTLLYDESQAHLPAFPKQENRKHDELRYVTARVAHRPHTLTFTYTSAIRKDSAVHVSLSSDSIVKQQSQSSNSVIWSNIIICLTQATCLHPDTETLSPRFAQPGGFEARETREKRAAPAPQGSVAVGARLIGRARSHCQPAFSKNFKKAP